MAPTSRCSLPPTRPRRLCLPFGQRQVLRFFRNPHKPMILALSRPNPKKTVTILLKAYGESRHPRELANLTLILGNRDDIEDMAGGAGTVLTAVLKLIDRYDLYGQVAYPKHHKQMDVPHIYRLAAKTKVVARAARLEVLPRPRPARRRSALPHREPFEWPGAPPPLSALSPSLTRGPHRRRPLLGRRRPRLPRRAARDGAGGPRRRPPPSFSTVSLCPARPWPPCPARQWPPCFRAQLDCVVSRAAAIVLDGVSVGLHRQLENA